MSRQLPPGPRSLLGLSLARAIQRDIFSFSMDLADQYGDAASFRVGPVQFVQFTHPEQNIEVLVKQAKKFHKPRRLKRILGKWDGQGLVISDDDLWVRQRRLVQQAFHPRRVQAYAGEMTRTAGEMLDRWQATREIELVDEMHHLTLDIVCRTLFGVDIGEHAEIRAAVQVLQDAALVELSRIVPLPDWFPTPTKRRMRHAISYMKGLIDHIISQRRATGDDRGDLLSMLLLSVDNEGDGRGMSDQQARDEAMTLFLAGHETTATSLVWALYLLAKHPEIQELAAREIDEVLAGRAPTVEDLPRLRMVEMALKEAMRLYPAVYFTAREAIDEVEIGGWRIPRGGQVHLLLYKVYHDERWFPSPEEFRPDRFSAENEQAVPPGAYLPFGAGPRVCIGRGMAMMEANLVLTMILARYRLSLAAGQAPPRAVAQVSLHPDGPIRLVLEPRLSNQPAREFATAKGATTGTVG